jgi:hypothetical protein
MEKTNMPTLSIKAKLLVGVVVVSSVAVLGKALTDWGQVHDYTRFLAYLLVAAFAARFRVSLPKMTGSMAVNLPFILVALVELSLVEALLVAAASTFVQTYWPESKKRNTVHVLFNVAVLMIATQLTWLTMRTEARSAALAIVLGALTVLITNTMPVAAIIAITEKGSLARIWMQILRLTFPYYLLAAGIAGLVKLANHAVGWQVPLFILPAMLLVYRSYTTYFHQLSDLATLRTSGVMAARAGSH